MIRLSKQEDSPATCRQRRRLRIEKRRSRPNWPPSRPKPSKQKFAFDVNKRDNEDDDDDDTFEAETATLPKRWRFFRSPMPSHSEISIKGLAETSNVDVNRAVCVVLEDFCPPEVFSGGEALHFFAVYDGHDSGVYKEVMHRVVAEELRSMDHARGSGSGSMGSRSHRQWWNDHIISALQRSFRRMDRMAQSGSGVAVAILTAEHIFAARFEGGMSRVVLRSDGVPIPLCDDRRSSNRSSDESEKKCGVGKLISPKDLDVIREVPLGTRRSAEAEIFMIERSRDEDDECLIIATHGFWDFMSDNMACDVANQCLRDFDTIITTTTTSYSDDRSEFDDRLFQSTTKTTCAASLLCRLAVGRGSNDGMSVIVVDLKKDSL